MRSSSIAIPVANFDSPIASSQSFNKNKPELGRIVCKAVHNSLYQDGNRLLNFLSSYPTTSIEVSVE